jgi:PAS domain S-box-containing protein
VELRLEPRDAAALGGVRWSDMLHALDVGPELCLALDASGRVLHVSRSLCELLGWSVEELVGVGWFERAVPAELATAEQFAARVQSGAIRETAQHPLLTRDGRRVEVRWRNLVVRGRDEVVVGTLSVGALVDPAAQARHAPGLVDRGPEAAEALRLAGVGTWDWDFASGRVQWSPAIEAMFGLPPGTFDGRYETYVSLIHPADRARVAAAIERAQRGPDHAYYVEHRLLQTGDVVRWIEGRGALRRDADGRPAGLTGTVVEITPRKELERRIERGAKAESLARLAGGVTHELSNLLAALAMRLHEARGELATHPAAQAHLDELERVVARGAERAQPLRWLAGRVPLQPAPCDPAQLLHEALAAWSGAAQAGARAVRPVTLDIDPTCAGVEVNVDPRRIREALLQLLRNADEASAPGTALAVRLARVAYDAEDAATPASPSGTHIAFELRDRGKGIPAEALERAFEPYVSTKPSAEAGLGLPVTVALLAQVGGSLRLRSEPGVGTCATVLLPCSAARASGRVAHDRRDAGPDAPPAAAAATPVLLVEDDDLVRRATVQVLRRAGFSVTEAESAEQGRERYAELAARRPVLVTDVNLPGASGPELAAQLRAEDPALPVLYVSGFLANSGDAAGRLVPAAPLLTKPFDPAQLVAEVARLVAARAGDPAGGR